LSGVVRWSRFLFNVLAWIFVGCVAIQVYLAGVGVFSTGDFGPHRIFAAFGLLWFVMIAFALLGRIPGRMIGATALLFLLFVVQSFLVYSGPSLAALHPLNGFLIGLLAVWIAWRTRGYLRGPEPAA
jgi:putative tricarboxylic transport membrane protein